MTAGCYYDNASFVDEEERKVQQQKQKHKQQQQQQLHQESSISAKPTLLSLSSRSPGVHRHQLGGADGAAINDLLARQIDQQRLSEAPLSRNPSVRYSRRFPPNCGYSKSAAATKAVAMTTKVHVHSSGPVDGQENDRPDASRVQVTTENGGEYNDLKVQVHSSSDHDN